MTRDEIIDLFIGNAAKAAAEPVRVNNNDELNSALGPILAESESIFCPAVTDKENGSSIAHGQTCSGLRFSFGLCGRGLRQR